MYRVALLAAMLCVGGAFADITLYNSQADFLTVLGTPHYLETFNDLSWGEISAPSADFGPVEGYGYTMSADGGVFSYVGEMSAAEEAAALVIDFTGAPVTAVSGDFFRTNWEALHEGIDVTVVLVGGATQSYDNRLGFTGFTSDTEIAQIIVGEASSYCWATVDNLRVGTMIPEPSALVLLALGGLAMLLRR